MPFARNILILLLLCSPLHAQAPVAVAPADPAAVPATVVRTKTVGVNSKKLPLILWSDTGELSASAFGASLEDDAIHGGPLQPVRDQWVEGYRSIGLWAPYDGQIWDSVSTHNYIGAMLSSSDSEIRSCQLYNCRDACLWVKAGAGNVRSSDNHFYGARVACYCEGSAWFRSVNDTFADALIGCLSNDQTTITNGLFQHDPVRCLALRGGRSTIVGCDINVQLETVDHSKFVIDGLPQYGGSAGVQCDGSMGSITDSPIVMSNWIHPLDKPSGRPAAGVVVNADAWSIDTTIEDADGIDGTVGIEVMGQRRGLKVDCDLITFDDKTCQPFVLTPGSRLDGADVTLRAYSDVAFSACLRAFTDPTSNLHGTLRAIDEIHDIKVTIER